MGLPVVKLIAMTPEAQQALGGKSLTIESFPFRVGRESRLSPSRFPWPRERRMPPNITGIVPNNDLYIREASQVHNLSREHFLLTWDNDRLVLVDRGSVCGTIVDGQIIGGNRGRGECVVQSNAVIIAGPSTSPYVFKIDVAEEIGLETEQTHSFQHGKLEETSIA